MYKSILVLFLSVALLIVYRIFITLINKLFNQSVNKSKINIAFSFFLYVVFFLLYIPAIEIIDKLLELSNLEYYTVYCILGFSSIIWCYFTWSVDSIKSMPKWIDSKYLKIKKSIIFFVIFMFTLVIGYKQIMNIIDPVFRITNIAIITAAIALDRFMSQIYPKNK